MENELPKTLGNVLGSVPDVALKLILRKRNLPYSVTRKVKAESRVLQAIGEKLTVDELLEEIRLLEECSSKILYLRTLVDTKPLQNTDALYKLLKEKLPAPQSKANETVKRPGRPTLNYFHISDDDVRIKFSESQFKLIPDRTDIDYENKKMGFSEEEHTNVIVFSINRKTGEAILYFDTPWERHSHSTGRGTINDRAYFEYYERIFRDVFGESTSLNLVGQVNRLLTAQPRECKPRISSDTNSAQSKRRYANENLHDDPEWLNLVQQAGGRMEFDFNALIFLKDDKNLLDPINVVIHPLEGRVHIPANRLASEVAYVISKLR